MNQTLVNEGEDAIIEYDENTKEKTISYSTKDYETIFSQDANAGETTYMLVADYSGCYNDMAADRYYIDISGTITVTVNQAMEAQE